MTWRVCRKFSAFLTLFLLAFLSQAAQKPLLRVAVVESWSPPLVIRDNEGNQGIIPEIYQAVAQRIGYELRYISAPRNRVNELAEHGAFDLQCLTNPEWVVDPRRYQWLPPLFSYQDVIVARQGARPLSSLQDLRGKRLTAVHGYTYPALDPLFNQQAVIRDDVASERNVLFNVAQGLAEFGVAKSLTVSYVNQGAVQRREPSLVVIMPVTQYQFFCAAPNSGRVPLDLLTKALESLRMDGTLETILATYR